MSVSYTHLDVYKRQHPHILGEAPSCADSDSIFIEHKYVHFNFNYAGYMYMIILLYRPIYLFKFLQNIKIDVYKRQK